MKKKIFLFGFLAMFGLAAALLVFSCSKNDEPSPLLSDQKVDSRDDEEMPEEIAQLLTPEQIAAFWASKPTHNPANPQPGGHDGKRPKKWRPFFGWGDITSNNLPVLSNCTTPPTAEICYNPADCPGIPPGSPIVPPVRRGGGGDGHMTGYGQIWNTWLRFICGGGFDRWNGTYEKDEHILQYRPYSVPTFSLTPEYQILEYNIKVCNANDGDPLCWSYSTGDFEDSEGILRQQLHVKRQPPDAPSGMFIEGEGKIFTWGWLWY